jgi:cell shape-determining protein MreC
VQKKFIATYLIIFAIILTMMSLSRHSSEKIRGDSVALLAPLWETILSFKHFVHHPLEPSPFNSFSVKDDLQRLQLENQLLEVELTHLQKQTNEHLLLAYQIAQIAAFSPQEARELTEEYQKSLQRAVKSLNWRLKGIPARVIFRSFDTWNSSLWINVGEATNQIPYTSLIALNSPVVVGRAIVGIIDYVGQHQSRVRLITDNRLTPSVRASRGGEQDFMLGDQIENLLQQMNSKKQFPLSQEDQAQLVQLLAQFKQSLNPFQKSWYLAKGVLLGSSFPSRRGHPCDLKGMGFNYDFADEEGSSRDLRNGKSLLQPHEPPVSILKVNDILVTTGMDGIFPPGFQVAIVTQIEMLKEGDYFYDLKAKPIAGPLEELSLVFVLPPYTLEKIQE